METLTKAKSLKITGIICTSVSWCVLFALLMMALDSSATFRNYIYYAICIAGFAATITGCILLSLSSHKTIIIKDQKECGVSIFYLVIENLSIIIAALLTEIDVLYLMTSQHEEPLRTMAGLIIASFLFMVTGIVGLCSRRVILNLPTVLSLCFMAIAVIDVCAVLP